MPFQNQQFTFNQPMPPLPQTNQPNIVGYKYISFQLKKEKLNIISYGQITTNNYEIGIKRGLEPEIQNNEKKIKTDNKKEIELNDETEALFEEQFKSWEEQFLKWKEQNKNHPDKVNLI